MAKYIEREAAKARLRRRQMSKEHIEREAAKERLRIWLSGCVLDRAKMDKEETNELDKR